MLIGKTCPNCGRKKKDHTEAQKGQCGREMSANYKPLPPKKLIVIPTYEVNK